MNISPVVGAVKRPGEECTVWLMDGNFQFPDICSCCLADFPLVRMGHPLDKRNPESHRFPICESCRTHAMLNTFFFGFGFFVALVVFPAVYWWLDGPLPVFLWQCIFLFLLTALPVANLVCFVGRFLIRRYESPNCKTSELPVSIPFIPDVSNGEDPVPSWEGESFREVMNIKLAMLNKLGPKGLCLEFKNLEYADRFLLENGFPLEDVMTIDESKDDSGKD